VRQATHLCIPSKQQVADEESRDRAAARKLPGSVDSLMRSVNAAGADAEYAQYPGSGHLFTDPDLPEEFDPDATERFWSRVLAFCATHTTTR
jgi:dienelactone hydrolase